MKKTRKNMLRSSAAMLLVSALALTTATYAWFTTGHSGKVSQITLTAENESGIQLSADAENWKGTITLDELTALSTTTYSANLSPRSSAGTADSKGKLILYNLLTKEQEIEDTTGKKISKNIVYTADGSSEGIVSFDLYARNTGTDKKTLYLDSSASVKGVADTNGKTTGIENAIRVAFVKQGTQEIKGSTYVADAKKLYKANASLSDGVWLWEPNSKSHSENSLYSGQGTVATYAIKGEIKESANVTLNAEGILDKDTYTDYVTSSSVKPNLSDANTDSAIVEIPANSIVKFTVYIWLEGQDVDCTDKEANGSFTVDLTFNDGTTTTTTSTETASN
jgi:hypothetical protein